LRQSTSGRCLGRPHAAKQGSREIAQTHFSPLIHCKREEEKWWNRRSPKKTTRRNPPPPLTEVKLA
jgi:hypothetical protein